MFMAISRIKTPSNFFFSSKKHPRKFILIGLEVNELNLLFIWIMKISLNSRLQVEIERVPLCWCWPIEKLSLNIFHSTGFSSVHRTQRSALVVGLPNARFGKKRKIVSGVAYTHTEAHMAKKTQQRLNRLISPHKTHENHHEKEILRHKYTTPNRRCRRQPTDSPIFCMGKVSAKICWWHQFERRTEYERFAHRLAVIRTCNITTGFFDVLVTDEAFYSIFFLGFPFSHGKFLKSAWPK